MVKSIFKDGKQQALKQFWNADPFPYIIVDDFLDKESFAKLTNSVMEISSPPDFTFATTLEKNKTTFASDALSNECRALVSSVTDKPFLGELSELTGIKDITPLTEYKEHNFRFYHKMQSGGFLGSHVDHSEVLGENKVHFLNCIFYASPRWESSWGGETVLFDKWGFREIAKVQCRPNRLLIFLHTSQSFHGVSPLTGNTTERLTFYMDYYATVAELKALNSQSQICDSAFVPRFWKHRTTFVPMTLKYMHRYLPWYLLYLTRQQY